MIEEEKIIKMYQEGLNTVVTVVKDMSSRIDNLTGTVTNLNTEITDLNTAITDLKAVNAKQSLRIAELEARINKNSSNSSKPPSSDGYKKPPITNNRQKSGKSTGGQPGHEGRTLLQVTNPDERVEYKTPPVCDCGHSLKGVPSTQKTRQVFDIPKIILKVIEYIINETVCPHCGKVHKTEFPLGVTQPTQYGENLRALANYLTQYQLLPLARAVEAIADITDQHISEGTLVTAAKALSDKLEDTVDEIKQQIIASDVIHFDETGMRCEGRTKWMHVASTDSLTHYQVHDKRGQAAAKDIGILPAFQGTAQHDHWKPYYTFTDCTHAECNSHNLRYLKDIAQNYHQNWASSMASLLIEANRRVEELKLGGASEISQDEFMAWHTRYHQIIAEGILEDAEKSPKILNKRGEPKKSKPLQLLIKLQTYDIETLAFLADFDIDFSNNLAERDLRMQKLRQKISGCFRSNDGATVFSRIRSYISTARKNGISAMEAIAMAVRGNPFIPEA